MKHVKPIDPVSTWHLLNENEEDAIYYVSSLLKANRNNDQYEQYWFPTPQNPGDEDSHTPIQRRILQELRNLQEAEQLTLKMMMSHAANSLAISTGKTPCCNNMKLKRSNRF